MSRRTVSRPISSKSSTSESSSGPKPARRSLQSTTPTDKAASTNKKMSSASASMSEVESDIADDVAQYQTIEEIDHILIRPDMYIGENTVKKSNMYMYDPIEDSVTYSKVAYSTGLMKIFDEILINAADNVQRHVGTTYISVDISDDTICITNDGKSIPIEKYKKSSKYIPEVVFTQLRSGSNFNDNVKRTTGGRNGYGCKLTTIFSTMFGIEVNYRGLKYIQIVENNNKNISPPDIVSTREHDMVSITFSPDLSRFGVDSIDDTMKKIMYKRVHDLSYLPIELNINGRRLPSHTWDTFVGTYRLFDNPYTYVYTDPKNASLVWRIAFGLSNRSDVVSFVNYISTYEGGTHVSHITNQIINAVVASVSKSFEVTKAQVMSKMGFIISAIIENPEFTSQAKEKLSLKQSAFGSKCEIPEKMIKEFIKRTDIKKALSVKFTQKKTADRKKNTKVNNVDKLVEANYAGTKHSSKCTLFICEGLSAKTMVDAGMCILGHDYYGCYPLRGKILNTCNASDAAYQKNVVLNELKTVLGIEDGVIYETVEGLRYGKVVCVKDADSDGASIMGLVMNFFSSKFEALLDIPGFFSEFISPMIQVIPKAKGSKKIPFYNEVEYKHFIEEQSRNPTVGQFVVKFIKGLATNEDDDIKEYFTHYNDNCIPIEFDMEYTTNMDLAFHKAFADKRKEWLTTITPETHLPRTKGQPITCTDFLNNDMVLFAMDSCIRAIPSVVDGLKPSQRKVLYTLFKMSGVKARTQMKVFQLGGLVAKQSNYHHGDQSMNGAIIKMAQDYPGSNNIPLLQRSGQFGSRQENGEDAGQPRYISACLAEITRYIFPAIDDCILEYREEDNQSVEPNYYVPIIPMVLINGVTGIGTGWSTTIPQYDPYDTIAYVRNLLKPDGKKVVIRPYTQGYKGDITFEPKDCTVTYHGVFTLNGTNLNITEIPISYKISDLHAMLNLYSTDQVKTTKPRAGSKAAAKTTVIPAVVNSFTNNNTTDANSVNYNIVLKVPMPKPTVINAFKLVDTIKTTNMVAFDPDGMIHRYADIYGMIDDWYMTRYEFYVKRIQKQIDDMERKVTITSNKARFIQENIEETISVRNVPKKQVEQILLDRNYDTIDDKYDYLLEMHIYWLTKEKYEQLLKELEECNQQLEALRATTPEIEWLKDLDTLENYMKTHNVCLDALDDM